MLLKVISSTYRILNETPPLFVKSLRDHDMVINDAMVLLDREQGGSQNLGKSNVTLHSIIKTSKILDVLFKAGKIDQAIVDLTQKFLDDNKYVPVEVEKKESPSSGKVGYDSALCGFLYAYYSLKY